MAAVLECYCLSSVLIMVLLKGVFQLVLVVSGPSRLNWLLILFPIYRFLLTVVSLLDSYMYTLVGACRSI